MNHRLFAWYACWLGISSFLAYACPSYGQGVVADGTVGTLVSGRDPFIITGGSQRLRTLFHSFQEFSPNTADVLFELNNSQDAVNAVIGRVTGTNLSLIDGQLQLTGGDNPDLFLINPNGITLGANTRLLLPGSFFASTAESVLFNDELSFSSRNPSGAPLLNISTPIGLQFGNTANGITLNQSDLTLNAGVSLGLLGGNLQVLGSNITVESGYAVLGSVAPGSKVDIDANTFLLTYDGATDFQDILLNQGATVDVSGDGGGRFQLQGRSITLTDDAALFAFNRGESDGETLTIRATETLELRGDDAFPPVVIDVSPLSTGQGNNLLIETDRLTLTGSAVIFSGAEGRGAGGDLTINANDIFLSDSFGVLNSESAPFITASTFGPGRGGNLKINANQLLAQNRILVQVSTFGSGADAGDGGDFDLNVDRLILQAGSQVGTGTFGGGNAGMLTITATDFVEVQGTGMVGENRVSSGIFSTAEVESTGNAGSIRLSGDQLTIRDGGQVSVSSLNRGDAGNLTISAGSLVLNEGVLQAQVTAGGEGNININATRLILLRQNSEIITSATGTAAGGNITLVAPIILGLENSDIVANAIFGSGGTINITTLGLLGLVFREQLTPDNDITANSAFGLTGAVAIRDFDVQTDSGLVELSEKLADTSNQVVQGCTDRGNQFVVTGRGGTPMAPTERRVSRDRTWTDTRDLTPFLGQTSTVSDSRMTGRTTAITTEIPEELEASNWRINPVGQVELVATAVPVRIHNATCTVPS